MSQEDNLKLRALMSDLENKVPCVHCYNDVVRCDMPRVGICKPCFIKLRKAKYPYLKNYPRWSDFVGTG